MPRNHLLPLHPSPLLPPQVLPLSPHPATHSGGLPIPSPSHLSQYSISLLWRSDPTAIQGFSLASPQPSDLLSFPFFYLFLANSLGLSTRSVSLSLRYQIIQIIWDLILRFLPNKFRQGKVNKNGKPALFSMLNGTSLQECREKSSFSKVKQP